MDPINLLKSVPGEIAKEVYGDALSGVLKEAGKAGTDFAKTIRLVLFPLQIAGALQDRLAAFIDRSIRAVPVDKRIPPVPSLTLQVAERLKYQEDDIVAAMYISLLSSAMSRDNVGRAHPAFVHLIAQLAPDEALLLQQLSNSDPCAYLRGHPRENKAVLKEERRESLQTASLQYPAREKLLEILVRPEDLGQPDLIYTYIEHLVSLGLVSYTNEPWEGPFASVRSQSAIQNYRLHFIRLNEFGRLFHLACLSAADH
jgi:hypothetical protein